jgi:hypothetical protein
MLPLNEAHEKEVLQNRRLQEHTKMQSLLTEFLNDQEGMREPYRNEALCEKARALLAEVEG